jgi:hypothetical protein
MSTIIGGSSPSITFSDSTTQASAGLPLTGGTLSGALTVPTLNAPSGVLATQNGMTGIAKAWVNFNGTSGSVAIRSSMNVSSITYNGTGTYTVNFTTAMPNTNYAIVAGQQIPSNASSNAVDYPLGNITTSSYQTVFYQSAVPRDNALMMQAVFSL